MKFLATISCMFLVLLSFGQSQQNISQEEEILKYFSEAVKGNNYSLPNAVINAVAVSNMVSMARSYIGNNDRFVRYKAIDLIRKKGLLTKNQAEKQILTDWLLNACKDKDSGNSGVASKALITYTADDFPAYAADSIMALIATHCFHLERVIRLSGFIHNESTSSFLSHIKQLDSTLTARQKWAADLALARMGNSESVEYCLNKIKGAGVNDQTVTYLFPDLAYIRTRAAFDYMLQEINSDEKKCSSANPDNEKPVICAFRIMELVAPYIEDFPVKTTSYGELDTDNYDDTLKKVKEWISLHDQYSLISNIY